MVRSPCDRARRYRPPLAPTGVSPARAVGTWAEAARAARDRLGDTCADPPHEPSESPLGCATSPRRIGDACHQSVTDRRGEIMVCRPGLPSPSWRTFIRHHAYDLIASGACTEGFSSWRASAMTALHTLRRWRERIVASGLSGASRRSWRATVTSLQPSDSACAPAVCSLGRGECVRVGERGPPDARLARHWDAVAAGLSIHWGTTSVCRGSATARRWGVYPLLQRQGQSHTTGQVQDASL
jgi:hypothetical protein